MNHEPRLCCRDSCSDLLDAKTLFHAGDFDITTDRSFEKGETRRPLTSDPLDDDPTLLVTGDFDVFIGGVTN